jgi:hypothetical protein
MFQKIVSSKRVEIAVIAILILGLLGYAAAGLASSGSRVTSAERTLNAVVSHQNALNATFNDLNTQLSAINGSSTFNAQQAIALVDAAVANYELAIQTIIQDDASLAAAATDLSRSPWLTMVGRSNLDHESSRIAHARNALAAARTVSDDKVLQGRFWHAQYVVLGDLATLNDQSGSGDFAGAKSTLATMKMDVDQAVQQSTSPGLPSALHDLMVDFQTLVTDYGKEVDAQLAGDDAAVATDQAAVLADRTKISGYNIDQIGAQIDAFYQPLIDRYNSEIAAATA